DAAGDPADGPVTVAFGDDPVVLRPGRPARRAVLQQGAQGGEVGSDRPVGVPGDLRVAPVLQDGLRIGEPRPPHADAREIKDVGWWHGPPPGGGGSTAPASPRSREGEVAAGWVIQ